MSNSMTGFGRGDAENGRISCKIEAKSVNHRYLDIAVKTPRGMLFLEEFAKQQVKKYFARGKIEIFINLDFNKSESTSVSADLLLAKQYSNALMALQEEFNLTNDISLATLSSYPGVLQIKEEFPEESELLSVTELALTNALEGLKAMRFSEGQRLFEDIAARIHILENLIEKIQQQSTFLEEEYRQRLILKIGQIIQDAGYQLDEQRIFMEAAIAADKSAIAEEITRFRSHIQELMQTLKEFQSGRKMDFLLQEMNREVNTIGSKSTNLEITGYVVSLKSELEKIREQVQNIE